MTPEQQRALGILSGANHTCDSFARAMWPHSPSWDHLEHPGRGVRFAAGGLLNRLIDEGYAVQQGDLYALTARGLNGLNQRNAEQTARRNVRTHYKGRPCGSPAGVTAARWAAVTCDGCKRHKTRQQRPRAQRRRR